MAIAFVLGMAVALHAEAANPESSQPEEGSPGLQPRSEKERRQLKPLTRVDPNLPTVLIIGDSISLGYTPLVREELARKANIVHNPGNSQGTTHTLAHVDEWLAAQKWDVIHFNLGLHDLKRVKVAGTAENSDDPNDPYQADLETYAANLEAIVEKLKATGAKLVFATTTPFPEGVRPFRDPKDVEKYNSVALRIMRDHGVAVNDLCAFVRPKLGTLQKPKNVHFTAEGSKALAGEVARHISEALSHK